MGEIINFKRAAPETVEVTDDAICIECRHEWSAAVEVVPGDPVPWLECPKCGTYKGRFKYRFMRGGGELWHCNCGNNLFQMTRDYTYCPACGETQKF